MSARLSRRRLTAVWALIVIASLLGLVAILATWVNRQLLDNQGWSNTSEKILQDPAVQSALSTYVVNSLYDNVDVPAALSQRLPPNLQPLAAPAAAALRQPATDGVKLLLQRPRVQALWVTANTKAHLKLVNVIENKTGSGISTGNGTVTVDLGALVKNIGPQLGLPAAAVSKAPPNTGVITILRSDQLGAVQTAVRLVRLASLWLLVLVFVLFGAALYTARGARRETLRTIGWAFVAMGVVVLLVRRAGGNYAVDALVTSPSYNESAHNVWNIASSTLGQVGWASVFYGLAFVLGAVLAGPTRIAMATRRRVAPVLNTRPGIAWSAVGGVYLLLVLWGPTHALRTWQGILGLGALLAVGIIALRHQTLREAHARPDTRQTYEQLAALHDSGALSDEEFARAKTVALS